MRSPVNAQSIFGLCWVARIYFFKECLEQHLPRPLDSATGQLAPDAAIARDPHTAVFRWIPADERLERQ